MRQSAGRCNSSKTSSIKQTGIRITGPQLQVSGNRKIKEKSCARISYLIYANVCTSLIDAIA